MGQPLPSGPTPGLSTGERIRLLRERLHLRQKALAGMVDMSAKQLGRYERDKGDPTGATLRRLALALQTTTDYLVGLTDDPRPPADRGTPDERSTQERPEHPSAAVSAPAQAA